MDFPRHTRDGFISLNGVENDKLWENLKKEKEKNYGKSGGKKSSGRNNTKSGNG